MKAPVLLLLAGLALTGRLVGADPIPTPAQLEFFEKEVRPILVENCYECHGPKKQKSGLRLDSRAFILKGGEVGAAVVPGQPEQSRLILAINHTKRKDVEAMPSEEKKLAPNGFAKGYLGRRLDSQKSPTHVSTGPSSPSLRPRSPKSLRPSASVMTSIASSFLN